MSEKQQKINVPKDPVVIGHTPLGEPVHLDLKELIPTPDEDAERWDKTLDSRKWAQVNKIAEAIINNGHKIVLETVFNTASSAMMNALNKDDIIAFRSLIRTEGYDYIQDGLTTVVKKNGKVLRSMTANLEPIAWRPFVTGRIKEIVSGKSAAKN